MPGDPGPDMSERVLLAVELIPRGRVASYGDVGGVVGTGPRNVGNILSRAGAGVPWWRVVQATGAMPLLDRARPHWRRERIEVSRSGRGCDITRYRCDLVDLAARYDRALAHLTPGH